MRIKKKIKSEKGSELQRVASFFERSADFGVSFNEKKNLTIDVNFPDELRHFRFRRIAS